MTLPPQYFTGAISHHGDTQTARDPPVALDPAGDRKFCQYLGHITRRWRPPGRSRSINYPPKNSFLEEEDNITDENDNAKTHIGEVGICAPFNSTGPIYPSSGLVSLFTFWQLDFWQPARPVPGLKIAGSQVVSSGTTTTAGGRC